MAEGRVHLTTFIEGVLVHGQQTPFVLLVPSPHSPHRGLLMPAQIPWSPGFLPTSLLNAQIEAAWGKVRAEGHAPEGDTLVAEHIQITLDLGGHSPQELLAFWHRNHPATASGKTCPEILEELLAARRKDGLSERSLQNYRSRIGRFCHDFTGPISAVTSQDIDTWLAGLPVSRRTRNNYRGDLLPLWVFARRRNYLPRGWFGVGQDEYEEQDGREFRSYNLSFRI